MRIFDDCEAEEVTVSEYENCFFYKLYNTVTEEDKVRESLIQEVKAAQEKNISLRYYKKIEKTYFDKNYDKYVMYISLTFDIRKLPPQVRILDRSLSPNIKQGNSFINQAQIAQQYSNILSKYQPLFNVGMQTALNPYGMMNNNPYTNQYQQSQYKSPLVPLVPPVSNLPIYIDEISKEQPQKTSKVRNIVNIIIRKLLFLDD